MTGKAGVHSTLSEAHVLLYVPPFIKKHQCVLSARNGESSEQVSIGVLIRLTSGAPKWLITAQLCLPVVTSFFDVVHMCPA